MDNNNNNSKINRLIYDTLSLRRSILLPEIGVISVVCSGSIKNKPIKADDFPHYNLVLTGDGYDVDLCVEIAKLDTFTDEERKKIIADWLFSIRGKNGIDIPNCFTLTKAKKISVSSMLNLQLNTFAKKKYSSSKRVVFSLLGIILACAIYFSMNLNLGGDKSNSYAVRKIESVPVIDSVIVCDSIRHDIETVVLDSVKNDNYIVVSSFETKKHALLDKERLLLIYKDIKIFTIEKTDGNIINYIFKSDDLELTEAKKEYFVKKYPRIRGIWIYEMINNKN